MQFYILYVKTAIHRLIDVVLLQSRLLSEVESFEVFASVATAPVDKTEETTLGRVRAASLVVVLLDEFFNGEIATSYADNDMIFLNLHEDTLLAVLVNAFAFPLEAHFVTEIVRHLVNENSQFLIQGVVFDGMINECIRRNPSVVPDLHDNFMKSFNLCVSLLQVLQKLN